MTPDEARAAVAHIRAIKHDDEMAHAEEASLRASVLEAIAAGSPDAVELATIALSTDDIDFVRWFA